MNTAPTLKRSLSLTQLVLYGLGTTIGAGIYVLVGELAATAGYLSPLSFLLASVMATVTALSFAELSGRLPYAAGTAIYVREGFRSITLSTLVGFLVILAALISSAALVNGFVGYLVALWPINVTLAIILVVIGLVLLAFWGISESVTTAAIITVVEVAGLLLVVWVSLDEVAKYPLPLAQLTPSFSLHDAGLIFSGAILAFYAFIGFEDMVVVAEEVEEVQRNMPRAILLTLIITTILYMLVMYTAIATVPLEKLATSSAPLATVYQHNSGHGTLIFSVIGMFAIINGALIQLIMATRVVYGMSYQKQLPALFCTIHPRTRTPSHATFAIGLLLLIVAISGTVAILAKITSLLMLVIFALVNLALIRIKHQTPCVSDVMILPRWLPYLGFIISSGFVLLELSTFIFTQ